MEWVIAIIVTTLILGEFVGSAIVMYLLYRWFKK